MMEKTEKKSDDASDKAFVQIKIAMRKIDDRIEDGTLIVLKGHLVMEELIRSKLDEYLPRPEYLRRAGLSFFEVLCVARAVYPADVMQRRGTDGTDVDLWDIIEAWNTLRNRLAHRLEPTDTQRCIRRVLYWAPEWAHPLEHEQTQAGLSFVIGMVIELLSKLPTGEVSV